MNRWTESARAAAALALALALGGCGALGERRDQAQPPPEPTEAPEAPAADRGDVKARFAEALTLARRNRSAEALAAFTALEQDFPEHAGIPLNIGLLHLHAGRIEPAIGALSRAERIAPDKPEVHNALGVAYWRSGQTERARAAFERAIAARPDYADAHFNLGMLLEEAFGDDQGALAHYRRYLSLIDGEDLRVHAWIAAIEARSRPQQPATVTPESP